MYGINSFKIVAAHPDDEILFFNSIFSSSSDIIICYGASSTSESVTSGRTRLKSCYPFENVIFLDIPESSFYDQKSFKNTRVLREGISLKKNAEAYAKNYDKLVEMLSNYLVEGDIVFTHNPWGEYGHPEHVQVFHAVHSLMTKLKLKIFVSGYVSDRSFELMTTRYNLLGSESLLKCTNDELGQKLKQVYIDNNCWTWSNNYHWPPTEIFYRVLSDKCVLHNFKRDSSYPPLCMLTQKFIHGNFKRFISRMWGLLS